MTELNKNLAGTSQQAELPEMGRCPFNHAPLRTVGVPTVGRSVSGMQVVYCNACYGQGPQAVTIEGAIIKWNKRQTA